MRARRLLFPCASVVFLLAIPCVAFVFWTSQPSTVELPWMRWAFLASAAMLLLMLRPTLGVVVIDERGVRVRTLFKSAFIPWQDVRQVGKHDGLVAIPKHPAQNIFISRVRQPWAKDKYLPRLYRCFWRRKDGRYTQNVLNFKSSPALEAAIRHYWPRRVGLPAARKLVSRAGRASEDRRSQKGDLRGRCARPARKETASARVAAT